MTSKMIGGFFELELSGADSTYHEGAIALTSGRACFHFILSVLKPKKVYLPYFICDAILQPLHRNNIPFEFYSLNENLMPASSIPLRENEYIVYVNYFGLMKQHAEKLYEKYGNQLILDNTQAFFERKFFDCWSFNSARKFFGVPDGGFLYGPNKHETSMPRNEKVELTHLIERLVEHPNAYSSYQNHEKNISSELLKISYFSEKLLRTVNFADVIRIRKNNFDKYTQAFSNLNKFKFTNDTRNVPFCYPLWIERSWNRNAIYEKNIFIPTFWPEVLSRHNKAFQFEKNLTQQLLPLPVDHRYTPSDCDRVIAEIKNVMEN